MIQKVLMTVAAAASLSLCLSANAGASTSSDNYDASTGATGMCQPK